MSVRDHDIRAQAAALVDGPISEEKRQKIIIALVEANVAVMDAQAELNHWRVSFGKVQNELKAVLAVLFRRYRLKRFTITSAQVLESVPKGHDLWVGDPDPQTRVYEFRPRGPRRPQAGLTQDAVDEAVKARH